MDVITYALLKKKIGGLESGFNYKGSVATAADLPSSASKGDLYTVTNENNAQYVYDGTAWQQISNERITEGQIDDLFGLRR